MTIDKLCDNKISEKQLQKEFLQLLDEYGSETQKLARKYVADGLDSHPDEFRALRDKFMEKVRALGARYGIVSGREAEK